MISFKLSHNMLWTKAKSQMLAWLKSNGHLMRYWTMNFSRPILRAKLILCSHTALTRFDFLLLCTMRKYQGSLQKNWTQCFGMKTSLSWSPDLEIINISHFKWANPKLGRFSTFPYLKLEAKWRKNGTFYVVNCVNGFRNALNSL